MTMIRGCLFFAGIFFLYAAEAQMVASRERSRASMPSAEERTREAERKEHVEAEARAAGIAKHGACPYCEGKGKIPWVPPQVYGETGPAYAARLQNETRVESCGKCRGTGYKGSEYSILNPE